MQTHRQKIADIFGVELSHVDELFKVYVPKIQKATNKTKLIDVLETAIVVQHALISEMPKINAEIHKDYQSSSISISNVNTVSAPTATESAKPTSPNTWWSDHLKAVRFGFSVALATAGLTFTALHYLGYLKP